MTRHHRDLLRWLSAHFLAILAFAVAGSIGAEVLGLHLDAVWGPQFRRELLMTSGAWGSWMFLAEARTVAFRRLARFTILVPGLAMLSMTAWAYGQGYSPDRWVQWLLAGALALSLAWSHAPMKRGVASHPWRFAIGIVVASAGWCLWVDGAQTVHDPTLGLWWGAPVVAVVTSTWLPRLIAGQMFEASTVQV